MTVAVEYDAGPRGLPHSLSIAAIRGVAAQVRRQLPIEADGAALTMATLLEACRRVAVNGRAISVNWDTDRDLKDEAGKQVLGICDTDPHEPGWAYVAVNGPMTANRPDLALSTAAHELGHVMFDVPAALASDTRRYRAVAADARALRQVNQGSEGRANEFMGTLLVPSVRLHTRLLALARSEGLQLTRAPHQGRPGSPVLSQNNAPEAIAGIAAVLATEFGVSERFITVRMARYGLIAGGQ